MNGPKNYAEAQRILESEPGVRNSLSAARMLQSAQVHATLALSQAITDAAVMNAAYCGSGEVDPTANLAQWAEATS